jgi:hypothetical protein
VAARYYDHLTLLPALGEPGAPPPITVAALVAHVAGTAAEELVAAVLLEDDLHLRAACLASPIAVTARAAAPVDTVAEPGLVDARLAAHDGPAVLTPGQVEGRDPLPYPLSVADDHQMVPGDGVWAAYYRHAAATAQRLDSSFLGAWVVAEVGLRNALATARARTLGLDPGRYLVVPELGGGAWDEVVAAWAAAPDPLAGWQVLLRARWRWLRDHDGWFTFSADELAAYAAGLMLLRRWQRVLGRPGHDETGRP